MAKYRKSEFMIALPSGNTIHRRHLDLLQAGDVATTVQVIIPRAVINGQYVFHLSLYSCGPLGWDVYVPAAALLSAYALRAYLFAGTGIWLGWQEGEDSAEGWVNWLADRIRGPIREPKEAQPVITI